MFIVVVVAIVAVVVVGGSGGGGNGVFRWSLVAIIVHIYSTTSKRLTHRIATAIA